MGKKAEDVAIKVEVPKEDVVEEKSESKSDAKEEEPKKKITPRKKVDGGLAARMAMLNKAKGASNLAKGGKGAPPRKKIGKVGALASGMRIPMPGMGGHPGLKKKAEQRAAQAQPQEPKNLKK